MTHRLVAGEMDIDHYRIRFAKNGRTACCADLEGLDVSDQHDLETLTSASMDKIQLFARRIQEQHEEIGLPAPELDIVVFVRKKPGPMQATEEHLSFRFRA